MKDVIYEIIFTDNKGNELKKVLWKCTSEEEDIKLSKAVEFYSMIHDMVKIKASKLPH